MTQVKKYKKTSPLSGLRNSLQSLLSLHAKPASEGQQQQEVSENRYSVLYKLKSQYHHVGCSSQQEAQSVLSMLMSDENRMPVGIYDARTDQFEWEIVEQYFHSQHPASEQRRLLDEVLTIARALRRRDSSWQPGYLQKPGFFA